MRAKPARSINCTTVTYRSKQTGCVQYTGTGTVLKEPGGYDRAQTYDTVVVLTGRLVVGGTVVPHRKKRKEKNQAVALVPYGTPSARS